MKPSTGTAGSASHGSDSQSRFFEVMNSTTKANARKIPDTRTVDASATKIAARPHRPCRAASQPGNANAQNSASVYPAARKTPTGAQYQIIAAFGPIPLSSGNWYCASRARYTPATALATADTTMPAAT